MGRWKVFGIALLLAIGVGGAWLLTQHEAPPTWTLPDGTTIVLRAVTRNPNHFCRYGTKFIDFLYPFVPKKYRNRFRFNVADLGPTLGTEDWLVVWLEQRGPPTPRGNRPSTCLVSIADENGIVSQPPHGMSHRFGNLATAGWELWTFPRDIFPRGGRTIDIRLYVFNPTNSSLSLVGRCAVPNRTRRARPTWRSEPAPATRRTNGLEITLVSLESGLTAKESGVGWTVPEDKTASRATFEIRENGKPTTNWEVMSIDLSKAGASWCDSARAVTRWQKDQQVVSFPVGMWPESGWKMAVQVSRNASFPSEELWTVRGLPVPVANAEIELSITTNLYGTELKLISVSPRRTNETSAGHTIIYPPYARLHAVASPSLSGLRLTLLAVKDDHGREAQLDRFNLAWSGVAPSAEGFPFGFIVPEGARSLEATFALSRSRTVEFLVKPVLAQSARPPAY